MRPKPGLPLAAGGRGGFNTSVTSSDTKTTASDETSDRVPSSAVKVETTGINLGLDGEGFLGSAQRYTALILGMILCGILMSVALGSMASWRGVAGPMVLQAIDPIWAALVVLGCLSACLVIAIGVAKIVNPAVGTFVLGSGLGCLALGSGGYLDILFGGTSGMSVGLETLAWGVVVLLMTAIIYRLTGPLPDQPDADPSEVFSPQVVLSSPAVRSAGAGILAVVAVILFASNDLKGQSLAAAVIAGVGTGYLGRFLGPRVQPVLLYAAPCVFLAIGQVVVFGSDTNQVISSWIQGGGPRLGIPTPIDVAAGTLMGVSMGIGMSRGFVEAQPDP